MVSFEEIMCMAATIYGEARGEAHEGRVAVGWVIRNRASRPRWWGNSIKSVCRKEYQFSCWNDNDPNSAKVKEIAVGWRDTPILDDIVVQGCVRAALEVFKSEDPTNGADHYHTVSISPKWARGREPIKTIGRHIFYRLET